MLRLTHITKDYLSGDNTVHALRDVSLHFGKSEFVSILGPSGCGKTTLLNIIGGLDRYTSGEMAVAGVPTSDFRDRDWDTYRNHSIGFVFQSYNLIPHQSVLANVELALTLSGVGKAERRRRAEEALQKVGLGDQLKKKPSQMSGGQMQRVAIARALVNDPEILLADEPTGALDSETSVQIMELLKEVAKDKLVIMVTHNPDLAEQYSTRIIRLLDGKVISDEMNITAEQAEPAAEPEGEKTRDEKTREVEEKYRKKTSMSFGTALGLSMKNLMTKKGRTLLVAFAGSIGIIGIALILSLSNGINEYINQVQEDTLSTYPIQIVSETTDMSGLIEAIAGSHVSEEEIEARDRIYANTMMYEMLDAMMSAETRTNNLAKFKKWLESEESGVSEQISAVKYGYGITPRIYAADTKDGVTRLNPTSMFDSLMPEGAADAMQSSPMAGMSGGMASMMATSGSMDIWQEMIDNRELMQQQYEVLAGRWPEEKHEVVLVVDERNEVNDVYLYALGFKDQAEVPNVLQAVLKGEEYTAKDETYAYDEILNTTFKLILPTDMYQQNADGYWDYKGDNEAFMQLAVDNGLTIEIVGILRPDPEAVATSITGAIGYLPSLTEYVLEEVQNSAIVKQQLADESTDVLTGLPFDDGENSVLTDAEKADRIREAIAGMPAADRAALYASHMTALDDETAMAQAVQQLAAVPAEQLGPMLAAQMVEQTGMDEATVGQYLSSMTEEEIRGYAAQSMAARIQAEYAAQAEKTIAQLSTEALAGMLDEGLAALDDEGVLAEYGDYMPPVVSSMTFSDVLHKLGHADEDRPSTIAIYTDTFEKKDILTEKIAEYNETCVAEDREDDVISYTDYVALMMSSISTIINVISYVLIAFVSISLVVSSIMIGIITYISVLERIKEIGILRAIGASKKDISRVFNAETFIIGFAAGAMGIIVTLLLCIPANIIIHHLTDISNLAKLPVAGGIALILISMLLTTIAGLLPAGIAAGKDPVESLRSE
ncbi:MAG: ATP-binding cassette domain-containing protein [Ruminococcaceae bacterium]|nr:ATP-binding cassette domain-containing protein [Oscillospiraceae bacterium]